VCSPLASLPNELLPQKCQSLGLYSETPSCKTPTNLTLDRCIAQAQAFECLNCTHTLLLFSLVILFTAKVIYLNQASSGFEPESLVRFRISTWEAGNIVSSFSHSALPFIFFFGGRGTGRESTICYVLFLQQGLLLQPFVHL